ncbi:chaplin [Streptomyces sp. NPDC048718]|uniref:chaplin n=1 Tax=Streptomyces sp. NPDC048718 TaxID=3365587 RepID=UPI003719E32C
MSRFAKAAAVIVGTGAVALSGAGLATADAGAAGAAVNSPGVISGDVVEVPIDLGLNLCGDSINVIGLMNPAFGDICAIVDEPEEPPVNGGGYGGGMGGGMGGGYNR